MDLQIIKTPLTLDIFGFGGKAPNKDYASTAFSLSGKMWTTLKENKIANKGKNIWVYEDSNAVFAGVELDGGASGLLEHKVVVLEHYAYYKHVGPYKLIKDAGLRMTNELKVRGFKTALPYVEIYGHWNADESKVETELLMSLIH